MTVLAGMDLVCTECGKQLLLSDGGTTASGSRAGLAIAIVVVLLLLAGGAGFWLLRGGQEKPAPVVAPAPAASPAPVRPANGDCSRTDAERGLCTATSR